MRWTIEEIQPNVHKINFVGVRAGWSQRVLLRSDAHHDNAHCDRKLELKHLKTAKEIDAPIIDNGDLFCAMQGKFDPRKDPRALDDRDKKIGYLDSIVDNAYKDYGEYADNFAVLGMGNHEYSILDRCGTNLTESITEKINLKRKKPDDRLCYSAGYGSYIIFNFQIRKTVRQTINLYRHHGSGGGAPVTRGVIKTNRMAVWLDADIVTTGHDHNSWVVPITKIRQSANGRPIKKIQWHVKTASYKDEWSIDEEGGYVMNKGEGPKPIGAAWIEFYMDDGVVLPRFMLDLK